MGEWGAAGSSTRSVVPMPAGLPCGPRIRICNPGEGSGVSVEACFRGVLGNHKIGPAVGIVVGHGAAPLFSVDADSAPCAGRGLEMAAAVAQQEHASSGILSRHRRVHREEILGEKGVELPSRLKSVTLTPNTGASSACRAEAGTEAIAAVEKDGGREGGGLQFAG